MFANFYSIVRDEKINLPKIYKEKLLYEQHGGTPLLGVNGIVIKSHGNADSHAFSNAIEFGVKCIEANLLYEI